MTELLTKQEIKLLKKNNQDEYSKIWMQYYNDNSISLNEFCKLFGVKLRFDD